MYLLQSFDNVVEAEPSPSPDTLLLLPSGIGVSGIESWAHKLADVA